MRRGSPFFHAFVLVTILAAPCLGQGALPPFPAGKWWKEREVVDELRLTPDQQSKIEAIWLENRKRMIDEKAEWDKAQFDLNDVVSQPTVDEAAAQRAFEQVQKTRMTLERTTFGMRIRAKNVLSPEQQQKLIELVQRRRERQNNRPARDPTPNRSRRRVMSARLAKQFGRETEPRREFVKSTSIGRR